MIGEPAAVIENGRHDARFQPFYLGAETRAAHSACRTPSLKKIRSHGLDPFSETWKKEHIRDLGRASHFRGLGIAAKISSPIVESGDNRRPGVGCTVR
jgi:hypothetical protein